MYALCRTEPSLTATTTTARPNTSPAAAPSRHTSNLEQSQPSEIGPQTVLPSAAWALQDREQPVRLAHSAPPGCTDGSRPHALGTPKVGLSTWAWGGASATLTAVAGMPIAAAQAQPAVQPAPPRPQTAQPFRIRSRMARELHSGSHGQVRSLASPPDSLSGHADTFHIRVFFPGSISCTWVVLP